MTTETGEIGNPIQARSRSAETWVYDVLEPDQLSTAKTRFGRRVLSRGTLIILWALRIYVVVMVLLIGLEIWNATHGGG